MGRAVRWKYSSLITRYLREASLGLPFSLIIPTTPAIRIPPTPVQLSLTSLARQFEPDHSNTRGIRTVTAMINIRAERKAANMGMGTEGDTDTATIISGR